MTERYFRKAAGLAAFLFIFLGAGSMALASISVSPVRLDLDASHDKDVIRVTNQEDRQKSYQVEVVAWSQTADDPEVYAPTEAILAVPPLFTLQPGEEQLVRIGLLEAPDAGREQSYRVFITEIAPPQPEVSASSGVSMRLQIGVPLFVAPSGLPRASFDLVGTENIGGKLYARFQNNGNIHVKVSEIRYLASGIEDEVTEPTATYVHAGQSGLLAVPSHDGRAAGTLTVVTDSLGTLEYDLAGTP